LGNVPDPVARRPGVTQEECGQVAESAGITRLPEIRDPRAAKGRLCGVLLGWAAYWASRDLDERYEQAVAVQLAWGGGAQVNAVSGLP
jgi:hypothetical protein